ncbi:MAG: bi-domain-containing oxidoreductase [Verrucomicrobia bacterium]|nr:bi-domain-containing oxidoreductase [Verrucomicrobiota bacterium]
MKQILVKSGKVFTAELPAPQLQAATVKVAVSFSCISPGTEIMGIVSSAKKPLIHQIIEKPGRIIKALEKAVSQGIPSVYRQAQGADAEARPTGYSAAGVVTEADESCPEFIKGERVAVAGTGYAGHAEEVVVPRNLVMKVPEGVSLEEASTVALGGVALQGVRRADVRLGETVGVIGCGVLGLLTVQMLRAAGCRVVALDIDDKRLQIAGKLGADMCFNSRSEDMIKKVFHFSDGYGLDSVIITAATSSNEPLSQAFRISKQKGRVVLVGVVAGEFDRNEMYAKELDFLISTSYGPGRYDEDYERFGKDYPYGYVRWTEKRNMQAYLEMLARKAVRLDDILNGCYPVEQAESAFASLQTEPKPLLVTIRYAEPTTRPEGKSPEQIASAWNAPAGPAVRIGLIGAGVFVKAMHLPNIIRCAQEYRITRVADQSAPTARGVAEKILGCQFETDASAVINSDEVDAVLIGTRHNTHAVLAGQALYAGKAVLVEKPMCLTIEEYKQLCLAVQETQAPFMVGYNRRFSHHIRFLRKQVESRLNPLMIHYTMNAGYLPYTHWTQTAEGGGRILGEVCHILDVFRYLTGSPACSLAVEALSPQTGTVRSSDNIIATVKYQDGSVCSLLYTAIGDATLSKEKLELFCDQKAYLMDDYKEVNGAAKFVSKAQDKGHLEEIRQLHAAILKNERFPIPWEELCETWELSYRISKAVQG